MEGAHWRIYSNDALSWSFPGGLAVVENPPVSAGGGGDEGSLPGSGVVV